MTTRRSFLTGLAGIFAASMAPAAVGSGVLMPTRKIIAPPAEIVTESLFCRRVGSDDIGAMNIEKAWQHGALRKGEIITIEGRKRADGRGLQQFIVTSEVPAFTMMTGGESIALSLYPMLDNQRRDERKYKPRALPANAGPRRGRWT